MQAIKIISTAILVIALWVTGFAMLAYAASLSVEAGYISLLAIPLFIFGFFCFFLSFAVARLAKD